MVQAETQSPRVVVVVGDLEGFAAALRAGADELRLRLKVTEGSSSPFSTDLLPRLLGAAEARGVSLSVTLDEHIPQQDLATAAHTLWNYLLSGIEAIEVLDLGLVGLLRQELPEVPLYLSPKAGVTCREALALVAGLGLARVALSPDLTEEERATLIEGSPISLEVPPRPSLESRGAEAPPPAAIRIDHDAQSGEIDLLVETAHALHGRPPTQRDTIPPSEAADEPDPAPLALDGPARSMAVSLEVDNDRRGRELVVRARSVCGPLVEARWPFDHSITDTPALWRKIRDLPWDNAQGHAKIRAVSLRGGPLAPVADVDAKVSALWDAIRKATKERWAAIMERLSACETGGATPSAPTTEVVCLVRDHSAARRLLAHDPNIVAAFPAGPDPHAWQALQDSYPADADQARLRVTLPLATYPRDTAALQRLLQTLTGRGLRAVEVEDLGQLAIAAKLGLAPIAGDRLSAWNREAVALLARLGVTRARLPHKEPLEAWLALLSALPALPLELDVWGWWPQTVARVSARVTPSGRRKYADDGRALREVIEGPNVCTLLNRPVSRELAYERLARAGLTAGRLDVRRAPLEDPDSDNASLLRRVVALRAPGGPRARDAARGESEPLRERPDDESRTALRLMRIYGAAERLTRSFRERHGVACSPRCARCCAQFVPVWPVEGVALARGVRALLATDEDRRRLRTRALEQLGRQEALLEQLGVPRHDSEMDIWRASPAQLGVLMERPSSPCVLLAEGRCEVYEMRPLLCRIYGYPTAAIPGNLCRRLSAPLMARSDKRPMPSIPARHIRSLGEAIRNLQGLREGVIDMTTVAAVVAHVLRHVPAPDGPTLMD